MVEIKEYTTTKEIAKLMGVTPSSIIKKFMEVGMFVTIDQRLDKEILEFITEEFLFECKVYSDRPRLELKEVYDTRI